MNLAAAITDMSTAARSPSKQAKMALPSGSFATWNSACESWGRIAGYMVRTSVMLELINIVKVLHSIL